MDMLNNGGLNYCFLNQRSVFHGIFLVQIFQIFWNDKYPFPISIDSTQSFPPYSFLTPFLYDIYFSLLSIPMISALILCFTKQKIRSLARIESLVHHSTLLGKLTRGSMHSRQKLQNIFVVAWYDIKGLFPADNSITSCLWLPEESRFRGCGSSSLTQHEDFTGSPCSPGMPGSLCSCTQSGKWGKRTQRIFINGMKNIRFQRGFLMTLLYSSHRTMMRDSMRLRPA